MYRVPLPGISSAAADDDMVGVMRWKHVEDVSVSHVLAIGEEDKKGDNEPQDGQGCLAEGLE